MQIVELSLVQQIAVCDQVLIWMPKLLEEIQEAAEQGENQYYIEKDVAFSAIWDVLQLEFEKLGYSLYGISSHGFTVSWPVVC